MITIFFFFFQAEDGIRDLTVTGVQTCALPICNSFRSTLKDSGSPDSRVCSPFTIASYIRVRPMTSSDLTVRNSCRSEEHTSELQSQSNLVCRLLLEKKKKITK